MWLFMPHGADTQCTLLYAVDFMFIAFPGGVENAKKIINRKIGLWVSEVVYFFEAFDLVANSLVRCATPCILDLIYTSTVPLSKASYLHFPGKISSQRFHP